MNHLSRPQLLATTLLLLSISVARADLLDFLKKPTQTNAPAGTTPPKKKSGGLNLNDVLK